MAFICRHTHVHSHPRKHMNLCACTYKQGRMNEGEDRRCWSHKIPAWSITVWAVPAAWMSLNFLWLLFSLKAKWNTSILHPSLDRKCVSWSGYPGLLTQISHSSRVSFGISTPEESLISPEWTLVNELCPSCYNPKQTPPLPSLLQSISQSCSRPLTSLTLWGSGGDHRGTAGSNCHIA